MCYLGSILISWHSTRVGVIGQVRKYEILDLLVEPFPNDVPGVPPRKVG